MWHKFITSMMVAAAVLAGISVLVLKLRVQEQREHVDDLVAQITEDQEVIRVLEAEIGYLSSPRRLQEGVIAHMPLMPLTADQFIRSPKDIPFRLNQARVRGDARLLRAPDSPQYQKKQPDKDKQARDTSQKEVAL